MLILTSLDAVSAPSGLASAVRPARSRMSAAAACLTVSDLADWARFTIVLNAIAAAGPRRSLSAIKSPSAPLVVLSMACTLATLEYPARLAMAGVGLPASATKNRASDCCADS